MKNPISYENKKKKAKSHKLYINSQILKQLTIIVCLKIIRLLKY